MSMTSEAEEVRYKETMPREEGVEPIVVFTVDNLDWIQGHNSGCDSEGVNHEKTVNQ